MLPIAHQMTLKSKCQECWDSPFYQCKLKEVGADREKNNATRQTLRVLEAIPDLTAHPEGRQVIRASRHDIDGYWRKRGDSDARGLARAAHIVRKDIIKVDNSLNGKFSPECQKYSIPDSLLSLVGMLIKGPTTNIDHWNCQACGSFSQLFVFNSVSRLRLTRSNKGRSPGLCIL